MSSEEKSAKEAKPGGKSSASPYNNWAMVILVLLLAWVVIHVAQAHSSKNTANLCTFDALREFTLGKDADGLARISNNCAGSRVAGDARRTLWEWASADWRRASSRNTSEGYHEFCSVWKRFELTEKYYECSSPARDGRMPISYRRSHSGGGDYIAQVYNGTSRDSAEAYSDSIKRRHGDLLSGLTVAVADGYGQHRVLIGPLSNKREADSLCLELKSRNIDCFSKAASEAMD
jgi:hypothetical protein